MSQHARPSPQARLWASRAITLPLRAAAAAVNEAEEAAESTDSQDPASTTAVASASSTDPTDGDDDLVFEPLPDHILERNRYARAQSHTHTHTHTHAWAANRKLMGKPIPAPLIHTNTHTVTHTCARATHTGFWQKS